MDNKNNELKRIEFEDLNPVNIIVRTRTYFPDGKYTWLNHYLSLIFFSILTAMTILCIFLGLLNFSTAYRKLRLPCFVNF